MFLWWHVGLTSLHKFSVFISSAISNIIQGSSDLWIGFRASTESLYESKIKGITSRICQLLFVMQHSKLATPPWLKAHALLVVPHSYDLVSGRYVFIESCTTTLLAGCYTPLPKRLMPTNIPSTAKLENIGRGQGLCRYRHCHTLLVGHQWLFGGIIFVWVYTLFFRKILFLCL